MKVVLLLLVCVGFIACTKQSPKEEPANASLTPDQVVLKVFDALNHGDSATFVSLISSGRVDTTTDTRAMVSNMLTVWKKNQATVRIDSSYTDGSIAYVTYHIKITGATPLDTTHHVQLYKEASGWKLGW